MITNKPWWQSKTILALVTSLVVKLAAAAGFIISGELVNEIIMILLALTGAADVTGIHGRIKAEKSIQRRLK